MHATGPTSDPPHPDSSLSDHPPSGSGQQRLWTPWRMRYVGGGSREPGCIFCHRLAENDDVQTLILHRGERAFVIMNLYPYNTGHVMIVPNAHIASPEDAEPSVTAEMAMLRGPVLRAIRRALNAEGFNLGLNVGDVAGAGVSDHLHEHVVPRWKGDANFMPILSSTMVMPELLAVTYAKLRAELVREIAGAMEVTGLTVAHDGKKALVTTEGSMPTVPATDGEPLWRTVLRDARDRGAIDAEIAGWAGDSRAGFDAPVLLIRARLPATVEQGAENALVDIHDLRSGPHADHVREVMDRMSAGIDV